MSVLRTRALSTSVAVMVLLALLPSTAGATHWAPTTYSVALTTAPNKFTAGDSFYVRAIFSWNSSAAQTMRSYAQQNGYRYTSDARDISCCVDAQWGRYSTTMPNPVYDADDDDSNLVYEEAELTANSTSFPTAGVSYNTYLKFSRWYQACNDYFCDWYWESGSGTMRQIGQMSYHPCAPCEWDSVGFLDLVMANVTYPYKAAPAAAPASNQASVGSSRSGKEKLFHQPDLSDGLDAYAASVKADAAELLDDGRPAQGVATFSRPLSTNDLAALERAGLTILHVEAIATGKGPRVTVGTAYSPRLNAELKELAGLQDATVDGVVSATVIVDNLAEYKELARDPRLYLIDLSAAAAHRGNPAADVVLNDVYWNLMGWD